MNKGVLGWKDQIKGTSLKINAVQWRLMSLLPGAGTGQSKEVTGRALITFKLSFALSPTLHLFSTASQFVPKLEASLDTLAIHSKAFPGALCTRRRCHLTCLSWKMPPVLTSLAGVTSTGQYSPFSFSSRIWTHSSTLRVTSLHLHNKSYTGFFLWLCWGFLVFFFPKKKRNENIKTLSSKCRVKQQQVLQ